MSDTREVPWRDRLPLYVFATLTFVGVFGTGAAIQSWIDDARHSCPAEGVMFIDVDSLVERGTYIPPGDPRLLPPISSAGEL